jgi:pimeloyl-ACP methyl ester carboxylesterase
MGGKVAMIVALRHPEVIDRLCVVDVSPVGYGNAREFAGYIAAMQNLDLDALDQRSDAEAALAEAVPNPTVRSFLLQNLRREDDSWRWQVNLDVLAADLADVSGWPEERLADESPYPGPVLWIGGARSSYVADDYVAAMDRWFPHNRRVTIKNAGHWVHSEQPEVFVEVLRQFLG